MISNHGLTVKLNMRFIYILTILLLPAILEAQQQRANTDSLKQVILEIRADIDQINLNLATSQKKFKKGIAVATIGYAVTIAGGLMLGRKNDGLGKVLLVTGGATGVTGTVLMVDAFRYLNTGNRKKRKQKK